MKISATKVIRGKHQGDEHGTPQCLLWPWVTEEGETLWEGKRTSPGKLANTTPKEKHKSNVLTSHS